MPFTNEVAGGQGTLVRNWLQSVNFVAGVSGWQITKAGNAEFNNGTFRGSITSGNPAGKHVVINNGVTGDAVDIYNASNQLVFSIDNNGVLHSINPATGAIAGVAAGQISLGNTGQSGNAAAITFTFGSPDILSLFSGHEPGGQDVSITMRGGTTTTNGFIGVNQRNVNGALMQTDSLSASNNVFHMFHGFATTVGATGNFPHGASFTPSGAIIQPFDGASVSNEYTFNVEGLSSSNVNFFAAHADGTAVNNEPVECFGIVWE
jgi:hypothetical protein